MSGRNRGGSNKRKKNSNNKKSKFDAAAFWGDPEALPNPEGFQTSTPDPVAVVNSLGQPPLPGHGAASPHYFTLVYTRATQLAGALAMAGEIDDLTPEEPPEPIAEETDAVEDDALGDDQLTDTLPNDEDALTEASADDEMGTPAEASEQE